MTLDDINKPGGDMADLTNLSFRVQKLLRICPEGRAAPQTTTNGASSHKRLISLIKIFTAIFKMIFCGAPDRIRHQNSKHPNNLIIINKSQFLGNLKFLFVSQFVSHFVSHKVNFFGLKFIA
ncbi:MULTISPECIES: hypothetical protein [Rhizobium/Agrobacterium group]|uniref:Uncharacterized protein n=1 Tax=Agrobacterium vitis TaxID=373 RepID=A0ABW9TM78_AGRVI|nr:MULTISPECIES: hypothetical protein [Rhizobium/Agrobacterium group]MUO30044.1 hypothetical protein [Agrobacterium vitis]MUO45692.1 hypothetical protein [Agrobacterium vitis]